MGFVVQSSTGDPLPEAAIRRLVEVVDACRGQPEVFVVFRDTFPYQAVSVHATEPAARQAAGAESGLSYFGPAAPDDAPSGFMGLMKVTGTTFEPFERPVSRVVVYDAQNKVLNEFKIDLKALTNPRKDIEALFFTPSSVDKYAIPYLTRVYGVEFAAARRREWIKEKKKK